MDPIIQSLFADLEAKDKNAQYEAFKKLLAVTEEKVDWTYEVWDELVENLTDKDPHQQARAAQFLAVLAISDPEKRILNAFPTLWNVTKDPKFVTARHSLQSIWKVGLAGPEQKEMVVNQLVHRYHECLGEKNDTLIRFDIIQDLRKLYDRVQDEAIKKAAMELIAAEERDKYRKKYSKLW